jgi:DNA-binding transcriptional MerR regulator
MNDLSIDSLGKKYFSIGEVSKLCNLKAHTLRFWEKEFSDLRPLTKKGNRRYYQQKDVLLIKKISDLLYVEGLTIAGVKKSLSSESTTRTSTPEDHEIISDLEDILTTLKS